MYFCVIFCVPRLRYGRSHSDDGHVQPTAPCSAHAVTQARPTVSFVHLVISVGVQGTQQSGAGLLTAEKSPCIVIVDHLRTTSSGHNNQENGSGYASIVPTAFISALRLIFTTNHENCETLEFWSIILCQWRDKGKPRLEDNIKARNELHYSGIVEECFYIVGLFYDSYILLYS